MRSKPKDCLTCGKQVKGRSDKKFCDDYCRNTHNNYLNSNFNNFVRNINNALRRNRRMLEELIPAGEQTVKCHKQKLADRGFNFSYHTHHYFNKKGDQYVFCYDLGYLMLESDWMLIVKSQES